MSIAELADYHGIALPSMSAHIHIMLKARIVESVRKAGTIYLRMAPSFRPTWKVLKKTLKEFARGEQKT